MKTAALSPDACRLKRRKLLERVAALMAEVKALRGRCTHRGAVEWTDSPQGYRCTACHAWWSRSPGPDVLRLPGVK